MTFCLCCGVGASSRAGGWSRAGCCEMGTRVPLRRCWHLAFPPVAAIWPNSPYGQGNVKAVKGEQLCSRLRQFTLTDIKLRPGPGGGPRQMLREKSITTTGLCPLPPVGKGRLRNTNHRALQGCGFWSSSTTCCHEHLLRRHHELGGEHVRAY